MTICSKNFPSPITAISEKFHPPLYEGEWGVGLDYEQLELASELKSDLRDTVLGQEMACWFQCWKSLTGFVWLV